MQRVNFTPYPVNYKSFANDYQGLVQNHSSAGQARAALRHETAWFQDLDNTPADAETAKDWVSIGSSADGLQASFKHVGGNRLTDRTANSNGDVTVRHYQASSSNVEGWEVTRDRQGQYRGFNLVPYEEGYTTFFAYRKMSEAKALTMFTRGDTLLRDLGKG